jgi:adenine-specific DNA methylase
MDPSHNTQQRLLEVSLPVKEVNAISMYEMANLKMIPKDIKNELIHLLGVEGKGHNLPKVHNIHYYPARIPTSGARAVTLAAVLSTDVDLETFKKAVGFEKLKEHVKLRNELAPLYMVNPDRELVRKLINTDPKSITILDPMAGGGSIPLEALRLGFRVIAGDSNPVSYLLLRATIEFPAKYGKRLFELVLEESKKLIEYAKNELSKYYLDDMRRLIYVLGARHTCGGVVPLVKNPLLSDDKEIYYKFDVTPDKKVRARLVNKQPPPITTCPHCKAPISIESLRKDWVRRHRELIDRLLSGDEKAAEEVRDIYIPVAVQVEGNYREATQDDVDLLVKAAQDLAKLTMNGDVLYILPTSEIPRDNGVFEDVRNYGLTHWHHLFNPRQLLVLYKLIKYVRERAEDLVKKHGELGAAVVLYLALAISKTFNYNNILAQWHSSKEVIRDLVGSQYALGKKASLGYDFVEAIPPSVNIPWAFEVDIAESGKYYLTAGGVLPVLRLLAESLEGLWRDGVDAIYLWDATELSKHLPAKSVDVIHVDPPYYDQHDYSGIMEFFWQILQKALEPVLDQLFPPERIKLDWSPYNSELPRKHEIRGPPPSRVGEYSRFGDRIEAFLREALKVLKDDGLLVMWYTYGKLEGWEELFYRFYNSGYLITRAWQVWSQSPQKFVANVSSAFFTSILIVARPGAGRRVLIKDPDDPKLIGEIYNASGSSAKALLKQYGFGMLRETAVMSIANGLAAITRFNMMGATDPQSIKASYVSMTNKALLFSVSAFLESLAEVRDIKYVPISSMDANSRLYLFLFLLSVIDRKGVHRIPYDIANRLSQIMRADLKALVVKSQRGTVTLKSPGDIVKTVSKGLVIDALSAILKIDNTLSKSGPKSAELIVKEFSRDALAYAYYMLAFAGEKLRPMLKSDLESIMRVIGGAL